MPKLYHRHPTLPSADHRVPRESVRSGERMDPARGRGRADRDVPRLPDHRPGRRHGEAWDPHLLPPRLRPVDHPGRHRRHLRRRAGAGRRLSSVQWASGCPLATPPSSGSPDGGPRDGATPDVAPATETAVAAACLLAVAVIVGYGPWIIL